MLEAILRIFVTLVVAYLFGKLVTKIKLPAILGWLIVGMMLGPHALALLPDEVLNAEWYVNFSHILECGVGLMIGTELVWNKIKKSGKAIVITTVFQSLSTFLVVSLTFCLIFHFTGLPFYLGFIFGGIALATAPAPALSIVREFKTDGPVTRSLIPMAALDDIVGCIVFFMTITLVSSNLSGQGISFAMIGLVVILPLIIGIVCGAISSLILKRTKKDSDTLATVLITILLTSLVGFFFNDVVLKSDLLNFMLIGMSYSATFANMVSEEKLNQIMRLFNPILGVAIIVVILNLGAPLDYHLVLGAGLYTAIYIISRAVGKYFGAFFGAKFTGLEKSVQKYLGLTLLPHSGVSLVFTSIAVNTISPYASEEAQVIQGTIAAAAVINEIIAVIVAKKGFELAGEFNQAVNTKETKNDNVIITISRQFGSGGYEIAKKLSEELSIPFYDKEIIEKAATNSDIAASLFEDYKVDRSDNFLNDLSRALPSANNLDEKIYRHQADVLQKLAAEKSCIILGRNADDILKNYPHTFKVFIYAPKEDRIQTIARRYSIGEKEAGDMIDEVDHNRASYYEYFTHKKFGCAENYDLCLNSGINSFDDCVKIIKENLAKR